MSSLQFVPKWNININQLENGEPISAGEEGLINIAPRQLAENVFYVNNKLTQEVVNRTIFEEGIDLKVIDIETDMNTKSDLINTTLNNKADLIESTLNNKADLIESTLNTKADLIEASVLVEVTRATERETALENNAKKIRILALAGL